MYEHELSRTPGYGSVRPSITRSAVPSQSPLRVMGIAAGWFVAATVVSFLAIIPIGLGIGVVRLAQGDMSTYHATPSDLAAIVAAVSLLFHAAMVGAALWQAKITGGGDIRAGLGAGPIKRPWVLVALGLSGIAFVAAWLLIVVMVIPKHDAYMATQMLKDAKNSGLAMRLTSLALLAVTAPVWEELFFRGWLWTALSRHWRPGTVAVATAVPWLLIHMTEGWVRPVYLIPAAIIFSLARHYCGSVKAPLILHLANNSILAASMAATLWN